MYGDTEAMRKHVARLREQGRDIRAMADHLLGQSEAVSWPGRAGHALRERVREQAARLRETAQRHESAAEALDAHGQLVDELKDTIAEAERRATALLEDGALPQFEPPAPGHKDWLALSLPGVEDRG
jgi:methyl-accepting chemotaxis protein